MAQDRRVIRTKTALTKALFELLGEKEFSKISVTELAQRADVDRKTFYLHYHGVEEILEEFYEDAIEKLQEAIKREDAFVQSMDISRFLRAVNDVVAERMPLYRRLTKGSGYTYFMERIRAILKTAVEEALRFRGCTDDIQIQICAEVCAAGVMRAYLAWLKGELDLDAEEFAQRVGRLVNQGLGL